MKNVLLFGATGNVGFQIAKELQSRGYNTTAVVRTAAKTHLLTGVANGVIVVNLADFNNIIGLCKGYDIIISALGKSVSPFDRSKESFREIDFNINEAILKDAVNARVGKFIYISAYHAEKFNDLEYFRVHHEFSNLLIASSLNYSIIKPPAVFSAFKDLFPFAKKGQLVTLGYGDKTTNPIYEGDVATIVVDAINDFNTVIEAGGPEIHSRHEINVIIQKEIAPDKKVRKALCG